MSLVNDLLNQLQNSGAVEQMAGQLGAGQEQTGNAIAAALPMIMGALGNQAQSTAWLASVPRMRNQLVLVSLPNTCAVMPAW